MLTMFKCGDFWGVLGIGLRMPSFSELLYHLGIWVMTGIWYAIDYIYQLFMALGSARLFKEETIAAFSQRIYIVLGIVMLFFVTYQLFLMLISPDKLASKGEDGGKKLVSNVIVTIIILALTTFVFNFAYVIQDNILAEDVIGKLLFGTSGRYQSGDVNITSDDMYYNGGKSVATSIFSAFYFPKNATTFQATNSLFDKKIFVLDSGNNPGTFSYNEIMKKVESESPQFLIDLSCTGITEVVEFPWFFGLLSGGFCLWVLLSYCIDMGLRVVKMGFYQIIAPLTISMRIIPKQKKVFDKWLKDTLSCFADIFIRIFIMFFSIYIIKLIQITFLSSFGALWETSVLPKPTYSIQLFAKALIITGVFKFILDAPKLFGDLFGIKMEGSSSLTPGIYKRFNDNKLLKSATGAVGGAIGGAIDNIAGAKTKGSKNPLAVGGRKLTSGVGGAAAGAFRGFKSGFDPNAQFIKNIRDTRMINAQRRIDREQGKMPKFGDTLHNMTDAWIGSGSRVMALDARVEAAKKAHESHEQIKKIFNEDESRNRAASQVELLSSRLGGMQQVDPAELAAKEQKSTTLTRLNDAYKASTQRVTDATTAVTEATNKHNELSQRQATIEAEKRDLENRQILLRSQINTANGQINPQIDAEIKMGDIKLGTLTNQLTQATAEVTTALANKTAAQTNLTTATTNAANTKQQIEADAQRADPSIVNISYLNAAATTATAEYETVKKVKDSREDAQKRLDDARKQLADIEHHIMSDPNNIEILRKETEKLAKNAALLSDDKFTEELAKRFNGKTIVDIKYDPNNPYDLSGIAEFITRGGSTSLSSIIDGAEKRASDTKKSIESYAPTPKDGKKK